MILRRKLDVIKMKISLNSKVLWIQFWGRIVIRLSFLEIGNFLSLRLYWPIFVQFSVLYLRFYVKIFIWCIILYVIIGVCRWFSLNINILGDVVMFEIELTLIKAIICQIFLRFSFLVDLKRILGLQNILVCNVILIKRLYKCFFLDLLLYRNFFQAFKFWI